MSASREKAKRQQSKANGTYISPKKKQEQQDAFRRIVAATVGAVVVVALILLVVSGSGVFQANLTAMKIGDVDVSVAELDYYYWRSFYGLYNEYASYGLLDYLGIDPDKSLKSQSYSDDYSWAQYFEDQAIASLQQIVAQSEEGKKNGVTLTQSDIKQIDANIADVEASAAQNNLKVDKFLKQNYGRGITLKSYREFLERLFLANRYMTSTMDAYVRSDADLDGYYAENSVDFDFVDYHIFTISGEAPEPAEGEEALTDEEKTAYKEEQKKKADEMLAKVTTPEAFLALSLEYTEEDSEEDAEEDTDSTFVSIKASEISDSLKEYLQSEDRKPGDKTVIEDGDDFLVILFVKRFREEDHTVNVRHILIGFSDYETEDEARARADELYQQWKDGDATEDSFASMAEEYSTDGGSNEKGGLYKNVYKGQMVTEFNDWCFDEARKYGDTEIVETSYGCHIMFFVGEGNLLAWQAKVELAMNNAEYNEWLSAQTTAQETKHNWFGMIFTKGRA